MLEENLIKITELNDFVFCPISIYFHRLYDEFDRSFYESEKQINGRNAHSSIDNNKYSTSKDVITSLDVISIEYGLVGKIDIFNQKFGELIERKKKIKNIYDGYIFQLYAQYFCLTEMGYQVNKMKLYSLDDNKSYYIDMPEKNKEKFDQFKSLIKEMKNFIPNEFKQYNIEKCRNCIYVSSCDRGLV